MKNIPRCSKCNKPPSSYTELWNGHSIEFLVDENGLIEEDGNLEPGDPCCVFAECDCGHSWKLRGVSQITQLSNYQQEPNPTPN